MSCKTLLLTALLALSPCHAAYDITLNIRGVITAGGCTLSAGSKSLEVDMGSIATGTLSGPGHHGPEKAFRIQLENCSADTGGVRISFSGVNDSANPQLLAIQGGESAAGGVAIELLTDDLQPLALNQAGPFIVFTDDSLTSQQVAFYARYTATGELVRAGSANASATFTVEYQ